MTTRELMEARRQRDVADGTKRAAPGKTSLPPAIIVVNPKGGVTKSTWLASTAYHLYELGWRPFVIDTDVSNPDLFKSHSERLTVECIALDNEDGFVSVARRLADPKIQEPILISCGAGLVEVFLENAPVLDLAASRAQRPLIVVSPIDLDIDSFIHLDDIVEAMPGARVFVVRPRHYGRPRDFVAFASSEIGESFIKQQRVIDMPALPASLARRFKTDRMSLMDVRDHDDPAETSALDIWSPKAAAALAPILTW